MTDRPASARRRLSALPCAAVWCAGIASAAPNAAPTTGAPSSPIELEWVAASMPDCQGAEPVLREVRRMLASPPAGVHLAARAELSRVEGQLQVVLETQTPTHSGRRTLSAATCAEVRRAIALLLAMTLESEAARQPPPEPEPQPAAPPAPPKPPPVVETVSSKPAPPLDAGTTPPAGSPPHRGLLARLDGLASRGTMPGVGLGAGAVLGFWSDPFELSIGYSHFAASDQSVLDGAGRVSVSRHVIELGACATPLRQGPFAFGACASPQLSWMLGETTGLEVPQKKTKRVPGLALDLDLRLAPSRWGWFVALRPGLTWERPQPLSVDPTNCDPTQDPGCTRPTIFETKALAPRLRAGVGARF